MPEQLPHACEQGFTPSPVNPYMCATCGWLASDHKKTEVIDMIIIALAEISKAGSESDKLLLSLTKEVIEKMNRLEKEIEEFKLLLNVKGTVN